MKISQHVFTLGKCVFCGARQETTEVDEFGNRVPDSRTCIPREDGINDLRPEPKRRELACEDATIIAARMIEIAQERRPKCPVNGSDLYACLRTASKCGDNCEYRDCWMGPETKNVEEAGAYC